MEFRSLTVNRVAIDEHEPSTTSSNSNRSSSFLPTSPDNNSFQVPPVPDDPAPLQQHAEQSISLTITIVPTREQAWRSLMESIPHRMKMQQLQTSERTYQKEGIFHKKQERRLSKEVYVVVGLYALLQGALFTAVAQSSMFSCGDAWGLKAITIAVMIGTIFSVRDKLHRMGIEKQEAKMFERRQRAVYDKIALLQFRGSACDIDTLEPEHTTDVPDMQCIFCVRGLLVMGFLVGFSVLIMIACTRMVCHPCHCDN